MKLTRRYKCKFKGVQLKQAATKSKACCYGMIVAAAIDCGCTGYAAVVWLLCRMLQKRNETPT
jgi:hypothetical protein